MKTWIISIVALTCVVQAAPANAIGLGGSFSGNVDQSNPPGTYGMNMELYGAVGSINYPSLRCGGNLRLISETGTSYTYRETITYGNCINGGVIQISASPYGDGNSWNWSWAGGGTTVRGVLHGSGAPAK
jgi:hypothetical protein